MEATLTSQPLIEKIHGALSNSPYIVNQDMVVEHDEGHVRIEGTVASFFQKQMAQEIVLRLDGVERVENQLQVNWA